MKEHTVKEFRTNSAFWKIIFERIFFWINRVEIVLFVSVICQSSYSLFLLFCQIKVLRRQVLEYGTISPLAAFELSNSSGLSITGVLVTYIIILFQFKFSEYKWGTWNNSAENNEIKKKLFYHIFDKWENSPTRFRNEEIVSDS